MASYDIGKSEVCMWIRSHIPRPSDILDVGACDGKWRKLLPEYPNMDACEIFGPNAEKIQGMYANVYATDIADYDYDHYDLVIFGDVIEHMTVEKAQLVLEYAKEHADNIIIGVPFMYPQGEMYGNKWERHVQPDLTPEVFANRYPGFEILHMAADNYWYYIWRRWKR